MKRHLVGRDRDKVWCNGMMTCRLPRLVGFGGCQSLNLTLLQNEFGAGCRTGSSSRGTVIVPIPAEHAQMQDTRAPADTVEGNVAKTAGKVCWLVFVVSSMAGRPGGGPSRSLSTGTPGGDFSTQRRCHARDNRPETVAGMSSCVGFGREHHEPIVGEAAIV
jgi:hypothetical protein